MRQKKAKLLRKVYRNREHYQQGKKHYLSVPSDQRDMVTTALYRVLSDRVTAANREAYNRKRAAQLRGEIPA